MISSPRLQELCNQIQQTWEDNQKRTGRMIISGYTNGEISRQEANELAAQLKKEKK